MSSENKVVQFVSQTGYLLPVCAAAFFLVQLFYAPPYTEQTPYLPYTRFFELLLATAVVDWLLGRNLSSPTASQTSFLARLPVFRWLLLIMLPIQCIYVFTSCALLGQMTSIPLIAYAGLILLVGLSTGEFCIIIGHELIHSQHKIDRIFGGLMLCLVCYPSFKIEHVRVHHPMVATPEDVSSAKKGEGIYWFLPKAIVMNFVHAWQQEYQRLQDRPLVMKVLQNELVGWLVLSFCIGGFITYYLGVNGLIFFLLQSLVAITFLETINFIQHYGLKRRSCPGGGYEAVHAGHSWNAPYWFTQWLFVNMMRHSDHHQFPLRPYQVLRVPDKAPMWPFPLVVVFVLAFVPPLWKWIMDPIADYYNARWKT